MFAADARKHTPGKNAEKENFSMRILVCDDDAAFAGQLAEKIEAIVKPQMPRSTVDCAIDAAQLRALPLAKYDLAFLDIDMGPLNGVDLARRLHELRPDMQIKLIVVGNVKEIFYQNKIEEFQKQINKKMSIQLICLKDESIPKQTSETVIRKIKETEGEKILNQIQNTDYVAALCIDGKKMDNSKIKKSIATAEQRGKSSIAFVIGGSLGLSDAVVKRADEKISFSNMTFPHQLMRVMLMEVLADTICGK